VSRESAIACSSITPTDRPVDGVTLVERRREVLGRREPAERSGTMPDVTTADSPALVLE
jgi:hypothetical protein